VPGVPRPALMNQGLGWYSEQDEGNAGGLRMNLCMRLAHL